MTGAEATEPKRVLVVDDEPDIRLIVQTILSDDAGWVVDEAESGEQALDRCRSEGFDVVVLDYRMPRLTGMEVARTLRDEGYSAPIIIFSAYLSSELEQEAVELGLATVDKADPFRLIDRVRELAG